MKRMLFLILMNSRRTEGSVQPAAQGCPCNHKPKFPLDSSCPVPPKRTISVPVLSFWSLLPLGCLDENLRLRFGQGAALV